MPRGMELVWAVGVTGLFIALISGATVADSNENHEYSVVVSNSVASQVDREELSDDERALIEEAVTVTQIHPESYPDPAPAPPEPSGERRGVEDGEKKFVVVGDRVLVVTAEITDTASREPEIELRAVDRTDELVLREEELSPKGQAVVEYALESSGTVQIHSDLPDEFAADGYQPGTFNLFEGDSRFFVAHEGELVALEIEETNYLFRLDGLGSVGLLAGLLMTAPLLTTRVQGRLGRWTSVGLNASVALVVTVFFSIVVSPPAFSHPLKRYQAEESLPLVFVSVLLVTALSVYVTLVFDSGEPD